MGIPLFSIPRAVLSKLRHVGKGASLDRDGTHSHCHRGFTIRRHTLSPVRSRIAASSDWAFCRWWIAVETSGPVEALAPGGDRDTEQMVGSGPAACVRESCL